MTTITIDMGVEEANGMDIMHEAASGLRHEKRKGKGKHDPMGDKIRKLMDEGKTHEQAVAIAASMHERGEMGPRGGKKK